MKLYRYYYFVGMTILYLGAPTVIVRCSLPYLYYDYIILLFAIVIVVCTVIYAIVTETIANNYIVQCMPIPPESALNDSHIRLTNNIAPINLFIFLNYTHTVSLANSSYRFQYRKLFSETYYNQNMDFMTVSTIFFYKP